MTGATERSRPSGPGLAELLGRCELEPGLLDELRRRVVALRPLVDPAHERASWAELIHELGATRWQ